MTEHSVMCPGFPEFVFSEFLGSGREPFTLHTGAGHAHAPVISLCMKAAFFFGKC